MSEDRPASRLMVDVLAYVLARLLLVVVLTAVIFFLPGSLVSARSGVFGVGKMDAGLTGN